jgi:hypothetical protein
VVSALDFGAFAGYSYFKTETSVSYEYSIGSNNGTGGYSETNHAVNINFFYYPFRKRLFNISTGIYSGVIFTEREPVYDLVPFDFVREEPVRKAYFQAGFHLGLFLIVPPTKGSGLFFNFKIPVVQPGYGAVQLGLRLNLPY